MGKGKPPKGYAGEIEEMQGDLKPRFEILEEQCDVLGGVSDNL